MTPIFIFPLIFPVTLPSPAPEAAPTVFSFVQEAPKIPEVPFYSQFKDIVSPKWKKVSCGIASLAMVIDYYGTDEISANDLLKEGIEDGAYISNAGWSHRGLVLLSEKHGMKGETYDLSNETRREAFEFFVRQLKDGPAIVSVHYKMEPDNPIPHLVVINGFDGDTIYYNDPAAKTPAKEISKQDFLKTWKKRFIVIRPA